MNFEIGIIGIGFVGGAIYNFFKQSKYTKYDDCKIYGYDKYNDEMNKDSELQYIINNCRFIFLCLPTPFDENLNTYNTSSLEEILVILSKSKHNKQQNVFIKSTTTPNLCNKLISNVSHEWKNMNFIHNPEFLSAKTAFEDFNNQTHIVLGKTDYCSEQGINDCVNFYKYFFPNVEISICSSTMSEMMKISVNSFYASKIMILNEYYKLCEKLNIEYDDLIKLMLKNNWINPMHTKVPGTDGKFGYGGGCFPKDTKALCAFMKDNHVMCGILENVINECEIVRY